MTQTEIEKLVKKQRDFFNSGETLNVSFRISALEKLRACIIKYEKKINQAIRADLGKSAFESYMCETGLVLSELTYMISANLQKSGQYTHRLHSFSQEAIKSHLHTVLC